MSLFQQSDMTGQTQVLSVAETHVILTCRKILLLFGVLKINIYSNAWEDQSTALWYNLHKLSVSCFHLPLMPHGFFGKNVKLNDLMSIE